MNTALTIFPAVTMRLDGSIELHLRFVDLFNLQMENTMLCYAMDVVGVNFKVRRRLVDFNQSVRANSAGILKLEKRSMK